MKMSPRPLEEIAESLFNWLTNGQQETENYISDIMDCLQEAHQLGADNAYSKKLMLRESETNETVEQIIQRLFDCRTAKAPDYDGLKTALYSMLLGLYNLGRKNSEVVLPESTPISVAKVGGFGAYAEPGQLKITRG